MFLLFVCLFFAVTDVDMNPPIITGCPVNNIILTATPGTTYASIEWDRPRAFDDSGAALLISESGARSLTFVRVNAPPLDVEYVFRDLAGNQALCKFTISAVGKSLFVSRQLALNSRGSTRVNC